jgi:hypothetical protein
MAETTGKSTRKTSADKAPAARKSRTSTTADTPATAKRPYNRKTAASAAAPGKSKMSAEERYRMVEVAAYFLAERNNFKGNPVEYWTQAEAQISNLLAQ